MAEPQPTIDNVAEQPKSWWRNFVPYIGPGFLVSLAYLDPGNLETDLQAGANHRYELLWVILLGLVFALIIQSLAANLGVVSGKHLAEVCKAEYPESVNYCLWILAEIAVIAADIPKVIGTAFALNILFNIPVWVGVLCTGCSTLILLALESYGIRKLELLIAISVFVMAGCFYGEMSYVKPPAKDVIKGIFVPQLRGKSAVGDAIALFGALVMPSYNLFLHSALVLSRKIPSSARGIKVACRFFLIESGFALAVAFLINVAVISVSGKICSDDDLSQENVKRCSNLTLNSASFLLQDVLGRSSSTVYAVALLASGQSSTITGTYAGQYIMQGFLDLKMKTWVRNLMTRSIAITPSLVVSLIGGSSGAGQLIIIASMILSFELPFALIPLLKFSSSSTIMGPYKNAIYIIVISWILGLGIIGMNVYYFTAFIDWILHNHLDDTWNTLLAMLAIPLMLTYLLFMIYLAFRKDKVAVFIHPTKFDPIAQTRMESGSSENARNDWCLSPYREDLAHIHWPQ